MPTTPRGLRFPVLSETANVPRDVQNLAEDVDGILGVKPKTGAGTVGGMTTSWVDVAGTSLVLTAGRWLVIAKGNTDTSTAAARAYSIRLFDGTNSDQVAVRSNTTGPATPWSLLLPITAAGSVTVRVQVRVDTVDGAQLLDNVRIVAIPIAAAAWA